MGLAASNVISLDEKRRKKVIKDDIIALQSTQEMSPSSILSFNIANLIFANVNEISSQKVREKDPDLQSALFFARGRLYYLGGRYHDSSKIFQSVLGMADSGDLRALALLGWANCLFSQGDFLKTKSVLEANMPDLSELPDALRLGFWLLQGNLAFATSSGSVEAAAWYRKVFTNQTRSLWVQCLQQTLVGFNPVNFAEHRAENLKGLRNLLDAFIEVAAARYFASIVLTFS